MPPSRARERSIGRPLAYLMVAAGVHIAGVLAWHFMRAGGLARGVWDDVQWGLLASMWIAYAWLAVRQAITSDANGVLLTSLTLGTAFYVSDLILLGLSLWMPGLRQIDYDRGEYIVDMVIEATVFSLIVSALVAAVAAVAIAAVRLIRGWREPPNRVGA